MWTSDQLNHYNTTFNNHYDRNDNNQKQGKAHKEVNKTPYVHLYNTPHKTLDLQNNHPSFDFNYFFSSFLTSENKASNNNNQDSAIANKFYSNYTYNKYDSSAESMTKYFQSNQCDLFKSAKNKSTPPPPCALDNSVTRLDQGHHHSLNHNSIITINANAKKNLFSIFENAKNDSFYFKKKKKACDDSAGNSSNSSSNEEKDFLSSPIKTTTVTNSKNKKLFECSGYSTVCSTLKKKRFRKNNDQISLLTVYYQKNKNWSKEKIKEISNATGLKENKVYKWLWDQKNKEMKKAKFVVFNH